MSNPETNATPSAQPNWVTNATFLWERRRKLKRVGIIAFVLSTVIAFTMPKQYESTGRIMPPEQLGSGASMLAALARTGTGTGLGSLGSLASLFGARTSGDLYIDLLHSRSVADDLIDRFNLQHIYHKRYRIDTYKYLNRHVDIVSDKKSGVISLTFTDTNAQRARDIAQAYLDELNSLITRANTSSARREREFIEKRLISVHDDLQDAERALSNFSSTNTTLDIKEQTHAMVDATATLQAQLIVGQSELDSLQQIYGEDNVRVRAARARLGELQRQLTKISGTSAALPDDLTKNPITDSTNLYPSLRQLPRLAVPYADLYRRVRIQETVYELLSQQYEMSRIEEAKDTPVVGIIDAPLIAEKKSFPPRLLLMLILTALSVIVASVYLLIRDLWDHIDSADPRKRLTQQVIARLMLRGGTS